jgi:hypothetical protein
MCCKTAQSLSDEIGTVGNTLCRLSSADKWANVGGVEPVHRCINDLAKEEVGFIGRMKTVFLDSVGRDQRNNPS